MKLTIRHSLRNAISNLERDRMLLILLASISAYFIIFSSLSVARYDAFYAANDLGIFNHKIYNTLHGRFFLSAEGGEEHYHHMDYLILSLLPIYAIFPYPQTLLVIQSAFLAIGALPIYLLSKEKLRSQHAALMLSLSYLLYPALHFVNFYDYQSLVLAVPFLLGGFCFFERKSYGLAILSFFISMFGNETVPIFVMLSGIYLYFRSRRKEAAIIFTVALCWYIISMQFLLPSDLVAGQTYFEIYKNRYDHLGETQWQVVGTILRDPVYAFTYGGMETRQKFVFDLLAPTCFLALLDPAILISSPQVAANLLSKYDWMRAIKWQSYTTLIIPFVLISLVYSVSRLGDFLGRFVKHDIKTYLACFVFATCFVSVFTIGFGESKNFATILSATSPNPRLSSNADSVISMVPDNASVGATHRIFPHMWGKRMIYRLGDNIDQILHEESYTNLPDYIIIDYEDEFYKFDFGEEYITEKLAGRGYSVLYNASGIFLYSIIL